MVSVCIPTYNGEKYILQQLVSVLKQLDDNDEVLISDDSSTDNTLTIIENINDKRIKIFKNQKFGSPVYNMEFALKQAKGNYIFMCDQDDLWAEDKVRKMVELLNKYYLVISDAIIIDDNENVLCNSYYEWKKSGKGFWKNLYKNSYIGCAIAFRKELLNYALPFPKNIAMHDIWIGLIAEIFFNVFFTDEKLLKYRRHENNLTYSINRDNKTLSDFSLKYKIYYRLIILINIFLRYINKKILRKQVI